MTRGSSLKTMMKRERSSRRCGLNEDRNESKEGRRR